MTQIINWLKRHWLVLVLLLVIVVLINSRNSTSVSTAPMMGFVGGSKTADVALSNTVPSLTNMFRTAAPSESQNRIVIQNTNLSLKVKNVADTIKSILSSAQSFGGFLVDSYLSQPEDAASGNISVRVPSDKRDQAIAAFKQFSSKVVSESVMGDDVTDQYVDLDTRLTILNGTK
jgi:hypothetical protein